MCSSDLKQFELAADGTDQAALYFIRKSAVRDAQLQLLRDVIQDLLAMPEYDGTTATAQLRLRAKNAAKRALKTIEKGEFNDPARSIQTRRLKDENRNHP